MTAVHYFPLVGAQPAGQAQAADYHGRWLIADDERWIDPRECSALRSIAVELKFGYLVLRAPGMLRMDIPLDVIEDDDSVRFSVAVDGHSVDVVDEGELASAWISNVVGRGCSIVKVHPASSEVHWPEDVFLV